MTEIWLIIPSYPDYAVSSSGRVRRHTNRATCKTADKLLKQRPDINGYSVVTLMKPKTTIDKWRWTPAKVSRLVCEAFHGAPNGPHIHAAHNDGDKTNNAASNVRWASARENYEDQVRHGTFVHGERMPNAKLTDSTVAEIREHRRQGSTWAELSTLFSASTRAIRDAASGATWKHVKTPPA